mgnify:CR=1 FL=1
MAGPYLSTGQFRTRITANDAEQQEELGIWRFEAGRVLRYVKAGALIPAGEIVQIDSSVVSGSPLLIGHQIIAAAGATNLCAGVVEATIASLRFGWVTTYGPATARVDAVAPGSALGPSALTGVLTIRNTSHFNAIAVALTSGLSAGSAVFVSIL